MGGWLQRYLERSAGAGRARGKGGGVSVRLERVRVGQMCIRLHVRPASWGVATAGPSSAVPLTLVGTKHEVCTMLPTGVGHNGAEVSTCTQHVHQHHPPLSVVVDSGERIHENSKVNVR